MTSSEAFVGAGVLGCSCLWGPGAMLPGRDRFLGSAVLLLIHFHTTRRNSTFGGDAGVLAYVPSVVGMNLVVKGERRTQDRTQK